MWRRIDARGQSTVEYALVLLAFLSLVVALAAVWGAARGGRLVQVAREAAPYSSEDGLSIGLMQDLTAP